jgi:hypothetical protein
MLSGAWVIPEFEPVAMIPSGTKLTAFHSADLAGAAGAHALQDIVDGVAQAAYKVNLDRALWLEEIVQAPLPGDQPRHRQGGRAALTGPPAPTQHLRPTNPTHRSGKHASV